MSDAPDPLEAELAALRPRDLSPDLRRRIGERLAPRWRWWWPALGLLALAGLTAAVALLGRGESPGTQVERSATRPPEPATEDAAPTLQAYHRALMRSPDELELLLDRQAARTGAPAAQVYAFRPPDAFLTGEP